MSEKPYKAETILLHGGQVPDKETLSRAVPIYQTTSYVFRDAEHAANLFGLKELGNIYTRLMNPTTDVLEKRIAQLDGGTAGLAFSSGSAAITNAIFNIAGAGDEIVSSSSLYGGTYNLFRYSLPKLGITAKFVEQSNPDNFKTAITDRTKAIYVESFGNPRLDIPDYDAIAKIAKEHRLPFIVDNTVAPYIFKPIDHGADIVAYSATKFIGGHGTSIGGLLVDAGTFDWGSGRFPGFTTPDPSYHGLVYWDVFKSFAGMGNVAFAFKARLQLLRDMGACISPFNAFQLLQGLETLHLRMERHCTNARKVAEFLAAHPNVAWVNYPGLPSSPENGRATKYFCDGFTGSIIGFGVKGGRAAGIKLIDNVKLLSHLANIGDAKSLIIHPASTTHSQLEGAELASTGVTEDFVRLSVGIEHVGDIIADLDQALKA